MTGVLADTAAIIIGGIIGLLAKRLIPESWNDIIIKGLALVSIYIGITGSLNGKNPIVLIMSVVFGAMIGEGLKIEQRFNALAEKTERKFDSKGGNSNFAQGFVTASFIMCIGALGVVGSLNAGLSGDMTLLFTKTAIDAFGSIMFAASMGMGVIFACIPVFIIEGGIVMLANVLAPLLGTDVVNEMTCVGSLLIIAMGINMIADTKLKTMNYMPGILLPMVLIPLYNLVTGLW